MTLCWNMCQERSRRIFLNKVFHLFHPSEYSPYPPPVLGSYWLFRGSPMVTTKSGLILDLWFLWTGGGAFRSMIRMDLGCFLINVGNYFMLFFSVGVDFCSSTALCNHSSLLWYSTRRAGTLTLYFRSCHFFFIKVSSHIFFRVLVLSVGRPVP